ncbi:hypothetical protein [Actinomadura terrae]|uniref:hypothetical protein n=1 Tax=Actinomadura terrae TaxID=604353 RepID=UPI001FA783AE|nr:hypothetical protein [Actinomadura terrae]
MKHLSGHDAWNHAEVALLASGEASIDDLSGLRKKGRVSFYADPLSWLVEESVDRAIANCPADLDADPEGVGLITMSDECTMRTMREIARRVPTGRPSPLRFSGANPGSAGVLAAITHGFKGPSLTLSMRPELGLTAAIALAGAWLAQGHASSVVVSGHFPGPPRHTVQSVVVTGRPRTGAQRP